tara:strand:+ start:406 stop:813 length:408 start_codon:yes stop_codon:yes gene_type:complete
LAAVVVDDDADDVDDVVVVELVDEEGIINKYWNALGIDNIYIDTGVQQKCKNILKKGYSDNLENLVGDIYTYTKENIETDYSKFGDLFDDKINDIFDTHIPEIDINITTKTIEEIIKLIEPNNEQTPMTEPEPES